MSEILFLSSDPVLKEKNLEIMQQSGLDAAGTSGCLEGLVMLDKNKYQVVVIDDELSDVSGYEACLKVRQQQGVLIVLLGNIPDSDAWARVEELGFDLYLRKPVSPRELLARIKAMLRRPGSDKAEAKPTVQPAVQPQERVAQGQPAVQTFVLPRPGSGTASPPVEAVKPVEQAPVVQQAAAFPPPAAPAQPAGRMSQAEPVQQFYNRRTTDQVKPGVPNTSEVPAVKEVYSQPPVTPVQQTYDQAPAVFVRPRGPHISMDTAQQAPPQPEVIIPKQATSLKQEAAPTIVPPLERDLQNKVRGPVAPPPFRSRQPCRPAYNRHRTMTRMELQF